MLQRQSAWILSVRGFFNAQLTYLVYGGSPSYIIHQAGSPRQTQVGHQFRSGASQRAGGVISNEVLVVHL